MLKLVVESALRARRAVALAAAALVVWGLWSADHARLDVLPDFAPPEVDIQTEAPGFAPEQVEQLVTAPIESALGGVTDVVSLRSESIQSLSVVKVVFASGTDVVRARTAVAEALSGAASRLPAGVRSPRLSPLTSATMDVLKIGLTSDSLSLMDLRSFADWTLRPRLLAVPGVARVNVFGGEVRELEVKADPAQLLARGLALGDVVAAVQAATSVRGVGFVDTPNQRVVVDPQGIATSAEQLADAVVAGAQSSARLGDVTQVSEVPAPRYGDALIQGRRGVLLTLSAAYGSNTVEVTHALEDALAGFAPLFQRQDITLHPRLHRPASFVDAALANLRRALLIGGALVVVVLMAFLQSPRAALVSLAAIPTSLLAAILVLGHLGVTLNTMSLGGLVIALGEVVDDAVIDVENILRRLRESEHSGRARDALPVGRARDALPVVLAASLEVRRAVVYGTLGTLLVFVPLLRLGGIAGAFFTPLALSYVLAVAASLAVALTVTPALALLVFGGRPVGDEPRLQTAAKAAYVRILRATLARRRAAGAAVAALAVIALAIAANIGGEFLPEFREGHLVAQVAAAPGTSLDAMLEIGSRLSRELLAMPEIQSVEQQVGRAEQGEDTWGPNRSEFHIELRRDAAETQEAVRTLLAGTPGIESQVVTFLGDRISESLTGETAGVVVSLYGDDLAALDLKADEAARALRATRGAVDVRREQQPTSPHVALALRPEAMRRYGFRSVDVLDQLQAALAGLVVSEVRRGEQSLDVVVRLGGWRRDDPASVGDLLLRSPSGATVALGALADTRAGEARDAIRHEGGRRREIVTCNVRGRDLASFVAEAQRRISAIELSGAATATIGGTGKEQAQARRELGLRAAIGALAIVLLLSRVAGSARNLAVLLVAAPLALLGGVLAVAAGSWLRGEAAAFSLGSLVGFVTVFGITTRNGILLISHFRARSESEGIAWTAESAIEAAADRLVPILMTALVTALALLPVALSADRAGGEIDGPMAVVILGGIAAATLANLLLLPILCIRYGRFGEAATAAGR